MQGYSVSARTILRKKHTVEIGNIDTNMSFMVAYTYLDVMFVEYKKYLKDIGSVRKHFQLELATVRAQDGNTNNSVEIKKTERQGKQVTSSVRITATNVTSMIEKCLSKVIAPDGEGILKETTNKDLIERAMLVDVIVITSVTSTGITIP